MAKPAAGGPHVTAPAAGEAVAGLPVDAVEIGRVIGAWGIRGGLRIKPHAADPQALFSSKRWYLAAPDAGRMAAPPTARSIPAAAWPRLLRIVQAREQGEFVVATAHDLEDRDAAQALAGARVLIPRTSFPTPDAGEYYWVDLIGLSVRNREQVELGEVVGLIETGPHCVLRIRPAAAADAQAADADARAAERLIPFVDAYVDKVDLPGRHIVVDWSVDD